MQIEIKEKPEHTNLKPWTPNGKTELQKMMENSWNEKDDADMDQLAKDTAHNEGNYRQAKSETDQIAMQNLQDKGLKITS